MSLCFTLLLFIDNNNPVLTYTGKDEKGKCVKKTKGETQ